MTFEDAQRDLLAVLDRAAGVNRPTMKAAKNLSTADGSGDAVERMESYWIACLHKAFEATYPPPTVVLSKAQRDQAWLRYEFLNDVVVMERVTAPSPDRKVTIPFASRILWQVESELSNSGRQVAIDFSKLVAASAENKLMVVRSSWRDGGTERTLDFLTQAACACTNNLFVVFISPYSASHPGLAAWRSHAALDLLVFRFIRGTRTWESLSLGKKTKAG